jgi:hypothetical protein
MGGARVPVPVSSVGAVGADTDGGVRRRLRTRAMPPTTTSRNTAREIRM